MKEIIRNERNGDRGKKEIVKTKTVLEVENVKEGGNKVRNFHFVSEPWRHYNMDLYF
jgi:hypothetical protein